MSPASFAFRCSVYQIFDLRQQVGIVGDQVRHHRMFRRQLQRGRAEDGVHARGEDGDLVACRPSLAVKLEIHQRAFAAANPVALHGADFFRPAGQLVQTLQQFVGVIGDAQEPLLQLALLDQRGLVPPAAAVGQHLLVGQHGGALRTPVHLALLAIGQPALQELQEEPLVPAVVIRQAGGDFLRPVVGKAQALHLRLHLGDVAQRPLARRRLVLDGRVLRRQAERIPAHGMKHVVALHPHVARQRVANGVVAHVAHVQRARRIRQHLQHVVLLARARRRFGFVQIGILQPSAQTTSCSIACGS